MLQSLLLLIAFVLALILIRRRLGDPYAVSDPDFSVDQTNLWDHVENPFHCVACECAVKDCAAAAAMKDKVYLVGDDGKLPLPECTAFGCRCHYVHLADRRQHEWDRRASFGLEQDMYQYTHDRDRRISAGRRVEDWSVDYEGLAS